MMTTSSQAGKVELCLAVERSASGPADGGGDAGDSTWGGGVSSDALPRPPGPPATSSGRRVRLTVSSPLRLRVAGPGSSAVAVARSNTQPASDLAGIDWHTRQQTFVL